MDGIEFTLSPSPIFALGRPVTLLVGVEDQPDGGVRAYVGARYRGLYLDVPPDQADPFRQAWATGSHIWIAPVPPAEMLHREEAVSA